VQLQFVRAIQDGEHRDVEQAARLARQPGTRPDRAPGGFGGVLLHRHRELVGALDGFLDILGAEHFLANGETLVEQLACHDPSPRIQ
jgi:hypothetical protein